MLNILVNCTMHTAHCTLHTDCAMYSIFHHFMIFYFVLNVHTIRHSTIQHTIRIFCTTYETRTYVSSAGIRQPLWTALMFSYSLSKCIIIQYTESHRDSQRAKTTEHWVPSYRENREHTEEMIILLRTSYTIL